MSGKLRQRRRELKIKQTDLAKDAKVSPRQYQMIEAGNCRPNVITALRIARRLGATVEAIFEDPEYADYNTSDTKEPDCKHVDNLNEGERAVTALTKAAEILHCSKKIARLMKDYGENGQVNDEEFRPIFEELREVVNEAFM